MSAANVNDDDSIPSTMKAWRFHTAAGGAEKHMRLEDVPLPGQPTLPQDCSLIKVQLVCLNPVDIKFAETPLVGRFLHPMPAIPGLDGVGRIVKTTDRTMQVGQTVMFRLLEKQREGALAEFVVVSREGCVAIPANVQAMQAATVGTCGVTAYQAIVPFVQHVLDGHETPRVFINGGSGGTGTFQIQLAKALGCRVSTSCSTPNIELCRSLGADQVFDYSQGPVAEMLSREVEQEKTAAYDLVVDNADLPWQRYKLAHKYMKPGATYVQVGGDVSLRAVKELLAVLLLPARLGGGQRPWTFMAMKTSRHDAERILALMAEGKINIPVEAQYPFEDVPKAYEKVKGGKPRGKIIVRVNDDY